MNPHPEAALKTHALQTLRAGRGPPESRGSVWSAVGFSAAVVPQNSPTQVQGFKRENPFGRNLSPALCSFLYLEERRNNGADSPYHFMSATVRPAGMNGSTCSL